MLKKINRVLKLLGLKIIRANPRRKSLVKSAGIPYAASKYMGDYEWQNTPPHTSGYVAIGPNPVAIGPNPVAIGPNPVAIGPTGNSLPPVNPEWRTNPNDGITHYVGDDGHGVGYAENGLKNTFIGPEAKVFVGNPNANFVPVDIGSDDHEMTRVEQKAQQAFEKCCGLDSHPYRVDEIPRVEKPNSDNKTTS